MGEKPQLTKLIIIQIFLEIVVPLTSESISVTVGCFFYFRAESFIRVLLF